MVAPEAVTSQPPPVQEKPEEYLPIGLVDVTPKFEAAEEPIYQPAKPEDFIPEPPPIVPTTTELERLQVRNLGALFSPALGYHRVSKWRKHYQNDLP